MAYGNIHHCMVLQKNEVITTKNHKGEKIMIIGFIILIILFYVAIHNP